MKALHHKPPSFVVHPVAAGKITFQEFLRASDYLQKIERIKERNAELLEESPKATLEELPSIPRFTGDPNEDKSHIIKITKDFLDLVKQEFWPNNEQDSSDDVSIIHEESSGEEILSDSGFYADALSVEESLNDENFIHLTKDVEQTLIYSFEDICIDLVNGLECDNVSCCAKHVFPTPYAIRRRIAEHSDEQLDKAFRLLLKSQILKKRYYNVFTPYLEK